MGSRLKQVQCGFTLLELLIVMVLATFIVSVAGVGAQSYMDRSRFSEAVRDVNSILQAARALAMRDGQRVDVTFDPISRILAIPNRMVQIPESVNLKWEFPSNRRLTNSSNGISVLFTFAPDGSGHGGKIDLIRAGRATSFTLNWLIGSIKLTEAL